MGQFLPPFKILEKRIWSWEDLRRYRIIWDRIAIRYGSLAIIEGVTLIPKGR